MRAALVFAFLPAVVLGGAFSAGAEAATIVKHITYNPASACTLSIPTTDTGVRPKASGFRNEGTSSSAFVICGISDVEWNSLTSVGLWAVSLDEQLHDITCTGVIGMPNSHGPNLTYSSKTMTAYPYSQGSPISIYWLPADFGGTDPFFEETNTFSLTCVLPPQTAIVRIEANRTFEIGS